MQHSFKFSPEILSRLGEELIPRIDLGLIELVRNAYDADAKSCKIEVRGVTAPGGTIIIKDDGAGMQPKDIRDSWLLIGKSTKAKSTATKKFRRVQVGEKGLGRLAALRLGRNVLLETVSDKSPATKHQLEINWTDFLDAKTVEEVSLDIRSISGRRLPPGTTITISNLTRPILKHEMDGLARSLVLMSGPFQSPNNFSASLLSPEFAELEKKVKTKYFGDADYSIDSKIDHRGVGSFTVRDRNKKEVHSEELKSIYRTVPLRFEFWVFLLGQRRSLGTRYPLNEIKSWLEICGGIHFFESGIRVHPYADSGNDWIGINLMRVRSPEERPSTNNSIGRISVSINDGRLVQKTDRSGYIENEPFQEVVRFTKDVLNRVAHLRLKQREEVRQTERPSRRAATAAAQSDFEKVLEVELPPTLRKPIQEAATTLIKAAENEIKTLREDLQLYRSVATVGLTSAAFAHETAQAINNITRMMRLLRKRSIDADSRTSQIISIIDGSQVRLAAFANLPLSLLKRDKRRLKSVNLNDTVRSIENLYAPLFEIEQITVLTKLDDAEPHLRATTALIESILSNLVTNSLTALREIDPKERTRKIFIETRALTNKVKLIFRDSGAGLQKLEEADIWLPGKTSITGGTGFGLTIVRDATADLSGTVQATATSVLGGMQFEFVFPSIPAD